MDEGYTKFNCKWIRSEPLEGNLIKELNLWRDKLFSLHLIGADENGIGFGNISLRFKNNTFIITGAATGRLNKLNESHYVLVNQYDLASNSLICTGPVKASSESLSHAAVYECSPETDAVIHVHDIGMWENLIYKVPTTSGDVEYGTPEMANEITRLFNETSVKFEKILVMGGHREGIIAFGPNLDEAGKILIDKMKALHRS